MNCKEIQDSIITDYVDGQIDVRSKGLIDQHLGVCHTCMGFLSSIQKEAINPFVNTLKEVPNDLLWRGIKQTIVDEQHQQLVKGLKPDLWERFKVLIHIPRPAFALATMVTMIFMIASTGQLFISPPPVKINGPDQMEYLSTLVDEPVDLDSNSGTESQTPIEKVFL